MKKTNVIKAAALIIAMTVPCFSTISCKKSDQASETMSNEVDEIEETGFNDWQKKVLEAQGLSTNYNELDVSQKLAIRRMYKMKRYLDDKYGMEFEYAGYIPAGLMEKEQFFAYPKELGTDAGRNYVTVTTDEKGEFTDNYVSASLREKFEKMYNDFIQDYFQSDKAVVYISHFACDYEDISEMNDDYYDSKITGINQIFISDEICDEKRIKDFTADFYKWLRQKGISGSERITVIHADDFKRINLKNYTDFYDDESMVYNMYLYVYDDMSYVNTEVTVYRTENEKVIREKTKFDLNDYGINK